MSKNKSTIIKTIAELSIVIILAVIVAIVINSFIITTTRVHGKSMDSTLYGGGGDEIAENSFFNKVFFGKNDNSSYGDKVVIVKTKKVKAGDIIIFKATNEQGLPVYSYDSLGNSTQEQWIKRVIGVAGDEVSIKDGQVFLNGNLLDEPYINRQNSTYLPNGDNLTIKIGDGEIFVMGDNREYSTDSRRVGCIATDNIVGKVVLVFGKQSQTIKTPKKLSYMQLGYYSFI